MCILKEENYAFVHSADPKNRLIHRPTSDYAYISNKGRTIGVQHSSTLPLPPPHRQHLSTHMHTNKLMLHRNTYKNHFQVKKRRGVQGGAPDQACPLRPGGSCGGSADPVHYNHISFITILTVAKTNSMSSEMYCKVAYKQCFCHGRGSDFFWAEGMAERAWYAE